MARKSIQLQVILDQRVQSVEAPPHIAWAQTQINPHAGRQVDHACTASSTARSVALFTRLLIRRRSPVFKSNSSDGVAPTTSAALASSSANRTVPDGPPEAASATSGIRLGQLTLAAESPNGLPTPCLFRNQLSPILPLGLRHLSTMIVGRRLGKSGLPDAYTFRQRLALAQRADHACGRLYFYGGTFRTLNLHFAGRVIRGDTGQPTVVDRVGSVRPLKVVNGEYTGGTGYYPYGEEQQPTANNAEKFATYFRDVTGLDYANQRYYSSQFGRFLTPDPYTATDESQMNPASPASWNRYAYVLGDPVNLNDPTGNYAASFEPSTGDNLGGVGGGGLSVFGTIVAFFTGGRGSGSGSGATRPTKTMRTYFIVVKSDCYRVPEKGAVTREISFELQYMEERMPRPIFTNQGVIWVHLSGGLGSLDKPDSPSSGAPGTFLDQQSIAGFGTTDQSGFQRFSARLDIGADVGLGIVGFGGTVQSPVPALKIDKHEGYIAINDNIGGKIGANGRLIPETYKPCP